jgi:GH15 family glucan-1,4-alpha-glucosidase
LPYQPIENYGIIGDLHTIALVGMNGSMDWLCFPNFDSPAIFAAILDSKKGGSFKIAPQATEVTFKQLYWPDTNVLVSRFLSEEGVGEITDFMPMGERTKSTKRHQLVRRVTVVRGSMCFRMRCQPAFNFARDEHTASATRNGVRFESKDMAIHLSATTPIRITDNVAVAEFTLEEGEEVVFAIDDCLKTNGAHDTNDEGTAITQKQSFEMFNRTVSYWRRWLSKCTYTGRWREMVNRSALTLKLLTYEPTGAIVAAPTCSLPEDIGGERNWDYRYTWIRDAAFTTYALLRIGFTEEAADFMRWLEARCQELNPDGSLQIMYSIDGGHKITEETLPHLDGYRGSKPVRVGNAAYNQLQLDIYGELLDAVYLFNKHGDPISYDIWISLRRLIQYVCDNWRRPDEGIWEVRSGQQHFVYSKLMCWVALDRGIRLATKRSFPASIPEWRRVRDEIYEDIMSNGWCDKLEAFTQSYDSESLDAANLMMPLVFFLAPTDPRMLKTLKAINRSPNKGGLVSNSLVHRYNSKMSDDGLAGEEGTFNICTFWLVEALTRAGQLDEARLMFEKMLGYASHLGLYAEETGHSGEALGNFPQAFTHLGLISSAFNLDRALGKKG